VNLNRIPHESTLIDENF